jgi:hypothetical protein
LALFDEKIEGYKGTVMSYASDEFFSEERPDFMLEGVFGHPATIATTTPSFGKIHKAIMKDYNHYAAMIVQIHDESVGSLCLDKKARARQVIRKTTAKIMVVRVRKAFVLVPNIDSALEKLSDKPPPLPDCSKTMTINPKQAMI